MALLDTIDALYASDHSLLSIYKILGDVMGGLSVFPLQELSSFRDELSDYFDIRIDGCSKNIFDEVGGLIQAAFLGRQLISLNPSKQLFISTRLYYVSKIDDVFSSLLDDI